MLGFGLIKGLFVTLRNLFGPIFTIQYPDKRAGIFEYAKFRKQSILRIFLPKKQGMKIVVKNIKKKWSMRLNNTKIKAKKQLK